MIWNLFKESKTIPDIEGIYNPDIFLNVVGDAGICLFFLMLGVLCIFSLKKTMPKEAYKQRRNLTQLLGISLFGCSITRGLSVFAMWHNYYLLIGIIKVITTIFSLLIFIYLPFAIRAIKQEREFEALKHTIKDTTEKIDKLTDITEKIADRIKND